MVQEVTHIFEDGIIGIITCYSYSVLTYLALQDWSEGIVW